MQKLLEMLEEFRDQAKAAGLTVPDEAEFEAVRDAVERHERYISELQRAILRHEKMIQALGVHTGIEDQGKNRISIGLPPIGGKPTGSEKPN